MPCGTSLVTRDRSSSPTSISLGGPSGGRPRMAKLRASSSRRAVSCSITSTGSSSDGSRSALRRERILHLVRYAARHLPPRTHTLRLERAELRFLDARCGVAQRLTQYAHFANITAARGAALGQRLACGEQLRHLDEVAHRARELPRHAPAHPERDQCNDDDRDADGDRQRRRDPRTEEAPARCLHERLAQLTAVPFECGGEDRVAFGGGRG